MSIQSWQIKNWEYLSQISKQDRLPHAVLLHGAKGMGLEAFAEVFSVWLLCASNSTHDFPCGECISCQWMAAGTHPDRLIITPDSNSIKVDAIREIRIFSETKRHTAQYRVIIIAPAEAMNISASNALLKILEEPFENTIFFLVAHCLEQVLPTVLSRCQKIHFPSLKKNAFFAEMQQYDADMTHEKIEKLYQLSHGQPLAFPTKAAQDMALLAQQKLGTLLESLVAHRLTPTEAAEQIKVIEKESQMTFEGLIDIVVGWIYQHIKEKILYGKGMAHWYEFYDKLMTIKKYSVAGSPINQLLWLEDLFYAC